MAILVSSANIDADARLIIDFLLQHHTPDSNQKRFDWLYRGGPAGPARVWIARESETNEPVGMAAAFPRRVYVGDREGEGWVLGDFCVASQYRSLGPAVQLQRACLEYVDSLRDAIYVDFPSAAMTAVYRRLAVQPDQQMLRLARPLRVNAKFDSLIKPRHLASLLSSVVNTTLGMRRPGPRLRPGSAVAILDGPCGDEFTRLAETIGSQMGICFQRSRRYLNWRYREHPYRTYEIITLRSEGVLTAYAVVSPEGRHLSLVDVFGKTETLPELLASLISIARERKLDTVTAAVVGAHPWITVFRDMGFHRRESVPLVANDHGRNGNPRVHHGGKWFLTNGDRES